MRLSPVIAAAHVVVAGVAPARPAWLPAPRARRLDPLAALICAAVGDLATDLPADSAVAVGSAWGCVDSTLRVVDGMAAFGDSGASPTAFTTSVHHHSAGSLGELLGLHGPVATLCCGGTSGLAALRWALGQLAAGRTTTALVVAADLANPWTARTVAALSACPFAIGGGATALLLRCSGPGRACGLDVGEAGAWCDAGGQSPAEERALARSGGPTRRVAAAVHGNWWPTAALAAVPWQDPAPWRVRERGDGLLLEAWIGGDGPDQG